MEICYYTDVTRVLLHVFGAHGALPEAYASMLRPGRPAPGARFAFHYPPPGYRGRRGEPGSVTVAV